MSAATTHERIAGLYRAHGHHVQRRAARLLGSDADASEVVQEVFLSLLDDPSQFAGRSQLTTWLYAATTNRCLNRLRDGRNRARLVAGEAASASSASSGAAAEDIAELRGVLRRLPIELAQLAVYYYGDEMTQDEIAGVLRCSRRHVNNLLQRLAAALEASP